jgi:hypothetical protein
MSKATNLLLASILAVAAGARLWGINFGLPHLNCRPDEGGIVAIAGSIYHGDLNPHHFNYPELFMLAVAAVLVVLSASGRVLEMFAIPWPVDVSGTTIAYRVARYLSAAAGIASVLVVFRIGLRLFGRAAAFAAAAMLSLAFLHVRESHFGVTDAPMTFLTLVAFLFIVRLSESGTARDLIAAGVASGLATSTKYNAALIALPALFAILTDAAGIRRPIGTPLRRAALYLSIMAAAFLFTSPYTVLDFRQFSADVTYESRHLAQGHGVILGRGWLHHLTSTLRYGVGIPILAAGMLGFVLLLWRDRRLGILVALFPVSYYLLLGSGYTVFARYMLPVVPFLCLMAGYALAEGAQWLALRMRRPNLSPIAATAGVTLLLWPSAHSVVHFDRLLSRTDSRLMARWWIERQFPKETTIAQLGSEGGRVLLFEHDRSEKKYNKVDFSRRGVRPDLVIVPSSPLMPAPRELSDMARTLSREYELAYHRDVVGTDAANVYDWQDDFYLPLSGFKGIERPGPNLKIYIRRGVFPEIPRRR